MAGLMKEQQRHIDQLNSRVIRLETVLALALTRGPAFGHQLPAPVASPGILE